MKNGELQLESDFDVVEKQGVSKEYVEIQKILQEKEQSVKRVEDKLVFEDEPQKNAEEFEDL